MYTQELALLVFGKEALIKGCLTGAAVGKAMLPTEHIDDIVGKYIEYRNPNTAILLIGSSGYLHITAKYFSANIYAP